MFLVKVLIPITCQRNWTKSKRHFTKDKFTSYLYVRMYFFKVRFSSSIVMLKTSKTNFKLNGSEKEQVLNMGMSNGSF